MGPAFTDYGPKNATLNRIGTEFVSLQTFCDDSLRWTSPLYARDKTTIKTVHGQEGTNTEKNKSVTSAGKVMVTVFWRAKNIFLADFLKKSEYYGSVESKMKNKGIKSNEE